MDIWYSAMNDLKWYDHQQITTLDGQFVITIDSTSTTQAGLTPGSFPHFLFFVLVLPSLPLRFILSLCPSFKHSPCHLGSTAPFRPSDNHNQTYRSGTLQSWNKLCFTS